MALPNGPVATSSEAEAVLFDLVDVYDRAYEAAAAELSLSAAQACVLGRLDERRGMGGEPDPRDRRARLVARTPRGDEINHRFATAFTFARTAVRRLSPEEQDQLTALLRKALG
jgi:hypothetical protein